MPTIKIYPPRQLPDRNVSEVEFNIWKEELEVYLSQEEEFLHFLDGGAYATWTSQENATIDRIENLANIDANDEENEEADMEILRKRNRGLRTFLSIVAKCVSQGHYSSVIRHSTSFDNICNSLRQDYDIQKKGIHFFNILELKYDEDKMTPMSFYNQYRNIICNNLGKTGEVLKYKNNEILQNDERMTPMLEDIILLNAVGLIDQRLPAYLKIHYNHKMRQDDRLMDFKTDIMINVPKFIEKLDSEQGATLNAIQSSWKKEGKGKTNKDRPEFKKRTGKFCKLCQKCGLNRSVFTSHNLGDIECEQLTFQDKVRLNVGKVAVMQNVQSDEDTEELERQNAHRIDRRIIDEEEKSDDSQVNFLKDNRKVNTIHSFSNALGQMKPEQTQILTLFQTPQNENPVHIELDSGASLNFTEEAEAIKKGYKIWPNSQVSKLGDGLTQIKACGEIYETLFRNSKPLRWRSLVCKNLNAPYIGGTPFLKDNGIDQDFVRNTIHLHDRSESVKPTNPLSILPTVPTFNHSNSISSCENKNPFKEENIPPKEYCVKPCTLLNVKEKKILYPGQKITISVPHKDGDVVAVEPWEQNKNVFWPPPHLATVRDRSIEIENTADLPVFIGNDIKTFKVWETHYPENDVENEAYYNVDNVNNQLTSFESQKVVNVLGVDMDENMKQINWNKKIDQEAKDIIVNAHEKFSDVFNKDLKGGYNGYYGKHFCTLNWAGSERPLASKVKMPCYDHQLKGLQQEVMDELTRQGVLLVPQQHDIIVQSVCPSFLQRKQRAKNKPKHLLTKDDVRLLINFGPVNEKIKPVPTHVTKTDDVLIMLGRWKHLVVFDLYNGYFQNHMRKDAIPWLGVQTPFGGLRVIARSGQGLAGMAEEFGELTAKILKEELQEGICQIIVDDLYIGGLTQEEAALNYSKILEKLHNANLKITPEKTHIFPDTVDVLGWVWMRGGYLKPSPHRTSALLNTKIENIKKEKDMRSWLGLYKTLHIVTPNISTLLAPFETAVAGKESNEQFEWTHTLDQAFREAKNAIGSMKTLYLPSPNDQLLLVPDAAKGGKNGMNSAGIGHVLYAVKNDVKLPVRLHSAKLKDACKKWSPCELEALSCAVAIEKEFDLIRESRKPLIILSDNKPVHEAINLIKQGNFSTSARMSSFLTNINRIEIVSSHVSGKAKLNPIADHQSRFPSSCYSDLCSVCRFVDEAIGAVLEPEAKNCSILTNINEGFTSRTAWKQAQNENEACARAKHFLITGKPPPKPIGKHTGELWNDIRQYFRDASISKDGLLVVKTKPEDLSGDIVRQRIVIPKLLAPSLLYHLHNHCHEHPLRSQQKARFLRQFYAIGLDKHLDNLYKNCYKCSVIIKLPKEAIKNETKTEVERPQTHFHVDVIKRANQNILTIKDHFSSFQDAMLIPSETAEDLKQGIIMLTSGIRQPNSIVISPDNSPGFQKLVKNQDNDLLDLKIKFIKTDEINKNANAVIDRGCQEIEEEIKKLSPEGHKITQVILKRAVLSLNSKLRRSGKISAFEINSSRDQDTGERLILDNDKLRGHQLDTRKKHQDNSLTVDPIFVGDTVSIKNKSNKHTANDIFLAVAKDGEKIKVQKILHPLNKGPIKIMSKMYETNEKRLKMVHRPEIVNIDDDADRHDDNLLVQQHHNAGVWNPIDENFYNQEDTDDEVEEVTIAKTTKTISRQIMTNSPQLIIGDADTSDNIELEWDNSPEQLQLQVETDNEDEQSLFQPRRLFNDDDVKELDSLTPETSDDEVFIKDNNEITTSNNRLKRRNAIRRKKRNNTLSNSVPVIRNSRQAGNIVRRITRASLHESTSMPNSPSEVILDRRQVLDIVLPPRAPVVPEAVNLDQVQRLDAVLDQVQNSSRRPRRSNRKRIDYAKFNETGERS